MPGLLAQFASWRAALGMAFSRQGAMPLSHAMFGRIEAFIFWTLRRLPAAIARAQAGWTRSEPQARPVGPRPAPKSSKAVVTQAHPLPRQEAWLARLMPAPWHINGCGAQLRLILQDPEIAPHIASPPVLRLLRPLCRMFAISDALPPKPPGKPRIREPRAPDAEPRPRPTPIGSPATITAPPARPAAPSPPGQPTFRFSPAQ